MAAKHSSKKPIPKRKPRPAASKPPKNPVVAQKNSGKTTPAIDPLVFAPPARSADEPEFDIRKTKIKIVGLGGGGSNIVAGIARRIKKASFCIVNTDYQALAQTGEGVATFQFGQKFTKGLGTGMDPALAEEAAREDREKIKKLLEGNDLVILVASLGGGAGSGAAPIFAQISKSLGNLTYGIFSMPFDFEGAKKDEIARTALERTRPYLSALTILPNERVFQVVPKTTPFTKTMSFINDNLSNNLEGLIEMIYEPGMINIDFADVRTILSGQGKLAFLNTTEFHKGENPDIESFDNAFASQLYPYSIDKARGLLINISGPKELRLSEVNKILTGVNKRIHKEAKIILGVSQADQTFDGVKVTVLATGCVASGQEPAVSSEQKEEKKPATPKPVAPKKPAAKKPAPKKQKSAPKKNNVKKPKRSKIKIKQRPRPALETVKAVAPQASPKADDETIKIETPVSEEEKAIALRKNAIEVRKEVEREEKEMLEKEKAWEIPAFLRKHPKKN